MDAMESFDDYDESGRSKTNLIVNYLPQSMTDDQFRELFAPFGDMRSAKIVRKKSTGYSYGYGFVDFVSPADADRAVRHLDGVTVEHKKLKVAFARPGGTDIKQANLYVKNLPPNVTEAQLRQAFGSFGDIIQCRVVPNKDIAFVLFDRHHQAKMAVEQMNGQRLVGAEEPMIVKFAIDNPQKHQAAQKSNSNVQHSPPGFSYPPAGFGFGSPPADYYSGRPMRAMNRNNRYSPMSSVHFSQYRPRHPTPHFHSPVPVSPPNQSMPSYGGPPYDLSPPHSSNGMHTAMSAGGPPQQEKGHTLFVYNIGPEANEQVLASLFSTYGPVIRCNVIRKPEGQSRGFGFVTMKNFDDAQSAIDVLNGYNGLSGKPLQVRFKTDNQHDD